VIVGLKTSGWPDDLIKQVEADMHDRVHRTYVLDIKSVQDYLIREGRYGRPGIAPATR